MKYIIKIIFIMFLIFSCDSKKSKQEEINQTELKAISTDTIQQNIKISKDFIAEFKNRYDAENYKIRYEKDFDLNKDGLIDKIILFEPNEKIDNEKIKNSPVCVLIKNKDSYNVYENRNIIYTSFFNSMAEGFQDLVVKGNYLTLEQNTIAGEFRQNDYITFIYNTKVNNIILHKYGIERISVNGESDETITYDKNDFGNIDFVSFDIDTINEKLTK